MKFAFLDGLNLLNSSVDSKNNVRSVVEKRPFCNGVKSSKAHRSVVQRRCGFLRYLLRSR